MNFELKKLSYDLVVAGGGFSGICAAVTASRLGLKTAIINNRGYMGGNAGVEAAVSVNGATGTSEFNLFSRETGIVEEILLENLHRNPESNRFIWDAVLNDKLLAEKNLDVFRDCTVCGAEVKEGIIKTIRALSSVCETEYEFASSIFVEDTGDGTLGALAGADFTVGREGRDEYGESIAPEKADRWVLPSTMLFVGRDTGHPVKYTPPDFALDIKKTKLLENRIIPEKNFARSMWYYELGGDLDQVKDYDKITSDHRAFVYGVWDYIKNSGKFNADNYELSYVSSMPSKREWRRIYGDVVLTQNDLTERTEFEDVIAYGGWSIDLHSLEGIYSSDIQNRHFYLNGVFEIPLRACYSRNINNLFVASRCMSVSHVAHGSTRLIATLGMIGEAVGAASYICVKDRVLPREVAANHRSELFTLLGRLDHTVLRHAYKDPDDLMQRAKVEVSSVHGFGSGATQGYEALSTPAGIVLPSGKGLNKITLTACAKENTSLSYRVYTSVRTTGFDPSVLLYSNSVDLAAGENKPVTLHLENIPEDRYIFIKVEKNPLISLGFTRTTEPGVISMIAKPLNNPCFCDAQTMKPKEYIWRRPDYCWCFKTDCIDSGIYGAHNLTNGFSYVYRRPNMWVSQGIEGEYILARFPEKHSLKMLSLTFDSNPDFRYSNGLPHDFNVMKGLVTDYDVYIINDGKEILAAEVRGNYQRKNNIPVNSSEAMADGFKIVFRAANKVDNVRVFSLSAYSE